jgi:hypothetical protein
MAEEPTEVIPVRIRLSERERLDTHLDQLESRVGLRASRSGLIARALTFYLDAEAAAQRHMPVHASPERETRGVSDPQEVRASRLIAVPGERSTQTGLGIPKPDFGIPKSPEKSPAEGRDYDPAKFILGTKLCPRGHDYMGTGKSLLRRSNQGCRECDVEKKREKLSAQR